MVRAAYFGLSALGAILLLVTGLSQAAPPRLEKQGTAMRLVVQNKPFLILGGELGNSSASSAAYMAPHWQRLRQMHLNTVHAPVSWELIEPVERAHDERAPAADGPADQGRPGRRAGGGPFRRQEAP